MLIVSNTHSCLEVAATQLQINRSATTLGITVVFLLGELKIDAK